MGHVLLLLSLLFLFNILESNFIETHKYRAHKIAVVPSPEYDLGIRFRTKSEISQVVNKLHFYHTS